MDGIKLIEVVLMLLVAIDNYMYLTSGEARRGTTVNPTIITL
jgi:hypothetical protein